MIVSSRHLREGCVDHIIDMLSQFAPYMMETYPSTAYELALLLERRYTSLRIAYATECERGSLHVNTDYSYVEIVDEDGKPTDDEGYVVGTTFHNGLMPLLRYRMSDRTRWRRTACACGRTYPVIEPVTGKYEDTLYGSRGQRISPSVVTFAFKSLRGIKCSQVAQTDEGAWEVRVVPDASFSEAERNRLVENDKQHDEPGNHDTVREVAEIARTSAHKYRWIVNES